MYNEMYKFQNEPNWVNNVFELRSRYNLPLNDMNVKSMTRNDWKIFVKNRVKACALKNYFFNAVVIGKQTSFPIKGWKHRTT